MNLNLLIPPTASPRPQSRGQSRAIGGMSMSRASMNPTGDPNIQSMFKDRFSNINTAKATIEKQREFDAAKVRLQKEFNELDLNQDGLVTLEELQTFLDAKAPNKRFDPQITEEIYNMIDLNQDGKVTLEEFVTKYLETRQRLNERLNEVYKKIADHKRQRDEMAKKLKEVQSTEQLNDNGIMLGSILTVHVVEARDLKPMDMDGTSDPYVILMIEDQRIETNYKKSTLAPVWNESFTFDIMHGREPLRIQVMDKDTFGNDDFEGQCSVELISLRDQMKHDQWVDLCDERGIASSGRIRLMLQWVYSKVQYFSEYLSKWDETLQKDIEEKDQIERFIKQLENPFGFLDTMKEEATETDGDDENPDQQKSQLQQMVQEQEKKIKVQEQQLAKGIDNISNNIAQKLGFSYVPWFTLTKIVLGIYTILTCFVMFFRPDFINLTVCTAAIFMLMQTDQIRKWTFRCLVLGILFSLLCDLFWFMLQDYDSDQSDGGVEKGIRNFSLTLSYFSFFFRIIVALVFWKDSLDFNRIIKKQQDQVGPQGGFSQSPDRKRTASYKKAAEDAISKHNKGGAVQKDQASYNKPGNQGGSTQFGGNERGGPNKQGTFGGPGRQGGNGNYNAFDLGRKI